MEVLRRFGEVPSLGSDRDVVLRRFVERELAKESLQLRLQITAMLGITNDNRSQFMGDYRKYLNLLFFQDLDVAEEEERMRQELEAMLQTEPKLIMDKKGNVSVKDLFKQKQTKVRKDPRAR